MFHKRGLCDSSSTWLPDRLRSNDERKDFRFRQRTRWSDVWHVGRTCASPTPRRQTPITISQGWDYTRLNPELEYTICNGWKVWSNGTTSMPKSIPRLMLDKVRLMCSDLRCSLQFLCPKLKFPIKLFHMRYLCNINKLLLRNIDHRW